MSRPTSSRRPSRSPRRSRPRLQFVPEGAPLPVHQLRPGADAARRRRGQARGAGAGRGAGAHAPRPMSAGALQAPTTPPENLAATLREHGRAVLAPAGFARLVHAEIAELDALRPSWDDLPADAHLRDGGRYRRRRHASFVVDRVTTSGCAAARALAAGRIQRPARRPRALVRADRRGVAGDAGVAARCCCRSRRWRRS